MNLITASLNWQHSSRAYTNAHVELALKIPKTSRHLNRNLTKYVCAFHFTSVCKICIPAFQTPEYSNKHIDVCNPEQIGSITNKDMQPYKEMKRLRITKFKTLEPYAVRLQYGNNMD